MAWSLAGGSAWRTRLERGRAPRRPGARAAATVRGEGVAPTELSAGAPLVVGSAGGCGVVLDGLAPEHCCLEAKGGGAYATDVTGGGAPGAVAVDGTAVWPGVAYVVPPGAVVELRDAGGAALLSLVVDIEGAAAPGAKSMEALLGESFKQAFLAGASEEVRSRLRGQSE